MFVRRIASVKPMSFARMFASSLKDYPIDGFFTAKTYAIVGASGKKGTLGNIIASNFVQKYQGDVVFVNPKGTLCCALFSSVRRRTLRETCSEECKGH